MATTDTIARSQARRRTLTAPTLPNLQKHDVCGRCADCTAETDGYISLGCETRRRLEDLAHVAGRCMGGETLAAFLAQPLREQLAGIAVFAELACVSDSRAHVRRAALRVLAAEGQAA